MTSLVRPARQRGITLETLDDNAFIGEINQSAMIESPEPSQSTTLPGRIVDQIHTY